MHSGAIDAHQHFWRYSPEQYGWIGDSMGVLRRDFLPDDLAAELRAAGMAGAVAVQARQSLEETCWLLGLAARHDFIRGVVGWAPLADPDLRDLLAPLAANRKLRGVRHQLQDEPDDGYMLRDDFNRGVRALGEFGLAYDILIFERQLPQAIELADRHPGQTFVLDHIAKPRISERALAPWRENMRELARRGHVYVKVSGLATEADWRSWSAEDLGPYLDTVLEAFGPRRLMFGSDWPVCLLAAPYRRWLDVVSDWAAPLSAAERERLFGGAAAEAYRLEHAAAPRRYGSVIGLKSEAVERYKAYHAAVWPEVLDRIRRCNIRNYTIYLKDGRLFGYYEYFGSDHRADMERMAADPKTREWWSIMMPMQEPLDTRREGEWWAEMEEVFHLD
jgi:L-fuconolactonase